MFIFQWEEGEHDRTSQHFPPAYCCSGSHSLGTGDITSLSSTALAFLPPSPHPEPWPNPKVLRLLFPVRALLGEHCWGLEEPSTEQAPPQLTAQAEPRDSPSMFAPVRLRSPTQGKLPV